MTIQTLKKEEPDSMCDVVKVPTKCSTKELERFKSLVQEGGEVDTFGLEKRIAEAYRLAFHYEGKDLVGIVALKRPRSTYKGSAFRKAQIPKEASIYTLELGWAYTKPIYEGKGICTTLIQMILRDAVSEYCYSTARTDNKAMHTVLERTGFRRIGQPYLGREHFVQLFVRQGSVP